MPTPDSQIIHTSTIVREVKAMLMVILFAIVLVMLKFGIYTGVTI